MSCNKCSPANCTPYNPPAGGGSTCTPYTPPVTYTVSYNANGGNGAPGSQTKTHGATLTLSNTVPSRAGYVFLGWAASSTATSASYQPGGAYTANAGIILYAVWKETVIPVTNVSISNVPLEIKVGETCSLTATVSPSNATNKSVTWISNNTAVATVDCGGTVTGKSVGSVTVSATANDGSGKKGIGTFNVAAAVIPVTSISISNVPLEIKVGETCTLGVTVSPSNATNKSVTWSSNNTAVATVDCGGTVTGKGVGSVTISATANDGSGKKGIGTFNVAAAIEIPDTPVPGGGIHFCPQGTIPNDSNPPLRWVPAGIKIYLSPENQKKGDELSFYVNERYQMELLANEVQKHLENERSCDVTIGDLTIGTNNTTDPAKRVKESNEGNFSLHVCIHSNALDGTATGPRVFYLNNDAEGAKLAQIVYGELFDLYKKSFPNAIKTDTKNSGNDYVELRETKATAILVETAFHDNVNDAHWIIDNMQVIAKTIGEGIFQYIFDRWGKGSAY